MTEQRYTSCKLSHRLLAIAYDLILLFAVLFFITIVLDILFNPDTIQKSDTLYPSFLFVCIYLYYAWHWVHGGQTLGMKAWRVAVVKNDGAGLDWYTASRRFLLALVSNLIIGSGLVWSIFDPEKLTFYDRYSNTLLIKN